MNSTKRTPILKSKDSLVLTRMRVYVKKITIKNANKEMMGNNCRLTLRHWSHPQVMDQFLMNYSCSAETTLLKMLKIA